MKKELMPPNTKKCGHEGNYSACLCGTYDALLEGVVDTPSLDKSEHDGTCRTPECYEKRPTPAVEDWEKEFAELWKKETSTRTGYIPYGLFAPFRDFIRSLLKSDRKRCVEGLQGMMRSDDKWSKRHQEQVLWTDIGYNQAISDAITLITNLK